MKFRILNKDPVYDFREGNKITEGIDLSDVMLINRPSGNETEWWIKQILTNHSTLRCIKFRMTAKAPRSVIMQIIRATKENPQPEVESSRPDWTGKARSSDPYEEKLFSQDHTAWSFIEMAKQRLCGRTERMTRNFMELAVETLKASKDPFLQAVGYCCHPVCWWYGGMCPEIKGCGKEPAKLADKVIYLYRTTEAAYENSN